MRNRRPLPRRNGRNRFGVSIALGTLPLGLAQTRGRESPAKADTSCAWKHQPECASVRIL